MANGAGFGRLHVLPHPPCQKVVEEAEENEDIFGHPYEGQLSVLSGFIPQKPPLLSLPPSHKIWDEYAASIPDYFTEAKDRRVLAAMPQLDASAESLPAAYLCRSVCILGHLAHSYIMGNYLGGEPMVRTLPSCIETPWRQVSERLGRPHPGLSFTDLVTYNWRLRNPADYIPGQAGLEYENLDLLIDIYATEEERSHFLAFFLTMVQATPLIRTIILAQQAVLAKDDRTLATTLLAVGDIIKSMREGLLLQDPNPFSPTFSDPIIWARTTATFPGVAGKPGFSGGAAPHIQLLDIFLGRHKFDSLIGQQMTDYRPYMPAIHVNFLNKVSEISVRDYIANSQDKYLQGVWLELFTIYCGDKSFLDTHKRKVYGFMEIAFKGGRKTTNAGFKGTSTERSWQTIDKNLESSRQERLYGTAFHHPLVPVIKKEELSSRAKQIVFDIKNTGITYQAGERCRIYVKNNPELVHKTLIALEADSATRIRLTTVWQQYLSERLQHTVGSCFLLGEFLLYAKIRPVTRQIAQKLVLLTASAEAKKILEEYREEHYEL